VSAQIRGSDQCAHYECASKLSHVRDMSKEGRILEGRVDCHATKATDAFPQALALIRAKAVPPESRQAAHAVSRTGKAQEFDRSKVHVM